MFLGIDHGTSAIRLAILDGDEVTTHSFERKRGVSTKFFEKFSPSQVELATVTYSMGDGLTAITPIGDVENRGVASRRGAGTDVGAGTELFDAIRDSGIPAVVLPGLHTDTPGLHQAFRTYSHCASAEKVAVAYRTAVETGERDFCIADIGSNTVTVAVKDGHIIGGLDATILAPGLEHGPLDVAAIRRIDAGESTANQEFSTGGTRDLDALSALVAMELRAVDTLVSGTLAITGRAAAEIHGDVEQLLASPVKMLDEWSAAVGAAEIAREVYRGAEQVLGIPVIR